MGWPYHFVGLNEEQKHQRRVTLDIYANIAQTSILTVLVVVQVYFLGVWLAARLSKQGDQDVISSPRIKEERLGHWNGSNGWQTTARKLKWWSGERLEICGAFLGSRGQIALAAAWLTWLIVLCIPDTGDGKSSSTQLIEIPTEVAICRLHPLHETFRARSSVPAPTPLPAGVQVPVLTPSTPHWLLPRNAEHLPPTFGKIHRLPLADSCSFISQLLHSVKSHSD